MLGIQETVYCNYVSNGIKIQEFSKSPPDRRLFHMEKPFIKTKIQILISGKKKNHPFMLKFLIKVREASY